MNSRAYKRDNDPVVLAERQERWRQFELAQVIFEMPEAEWEHKVQLLPPDQRPEVRRCLELLKEYHEN